ncbi:uncharacterized protein LOC133845372 isoform X2 [Drosophila sulfurigaster albostrigata]|nr:uncharacterized protein LOC133845372 isoform X2 [Drosophila sulfurigaster albostrigata]XP_062135815.1 uncharacterized protein LOC133845372 isoform X2 [Drosophila sulfurigaster albostrigata]XP_062135816.1 uncharacterized protein LOC133845372 isoform X2 [Drosophila sulfurigaster albostrigata]XP_062135817.1 uncharacterized protein LOC133845372 isoform X2 [Drosophila sulfurigaster albostrigata]
MSDKPAKRSRRTSAPQCDCDCAKTVKNLEDHFKLLTDLVVTVSHKIDSLQEINNQMQSQLTAVLQALQNQKAEKDNFIECIADKQYDKVSTKPKFPINSAEEMEIIDKNIDMLDIEKIASTITRLLQPNGVEKQLQNILTDDFVMAHNLDGVHGKLAIRSYKNFCEVLIEAIKATGGADSAEDQLRRALQLQKKRVFKKRSCALKKQKMSDSFSSDYF